MLPKILKTLVILIFFVNLQSLHAQVECAECQQELTKFFVEKTELRRINEGLYVEIANLENAMLAMRDSVSGYGLFAKGGGEPCDCGPAVENVQNRVNNLASQNANLSSRNRKLAADLAESKTEVESQQEEIKILQEENVLLQEKITELEQKIEELLDEMEELKIIVECLDVFVEERRIARQVARNEIERANELSSFLYYNPESRNEGLSKEEQNERINEAFDIYLTLGGNEISTVCSGRELSYKDDYLTGREHLTFVKILVDNVGNVVQKLGIDVNERVNGMNRLVLLHLGEAYDKGDYNTRSDVEDLSEKIGFLVVSEKKGNEATQTSEVLNEIKNIKYTFDKKDYVTSINLYNKYQRFFEVEGIQQDSLAIGNANYAAGVILSWNLASISDYKGFYINDTWLDNNINNRVEVGRRLLEKEVMLQKGLPPELRKKAMLAVRKQYLKEGKNKNS